MQPTDPFTVYSSPNSLAWYSFEGLPINEIRQDRHTLFWATLQLVRVGLWLLHGTVVLLTLLLLLLGDYVLLTLMPSVLWRCCVGGRKGIRPVKNWLAWFSVWREVQTCIWPSWCHCHSLSLALVKSRLVLPFWYRLTRVVPDKGPLNGCVCVCVWLWWLAWDLKSLQNGKWEVIPYEYIGTIGKLLRRAEVPKIVFWYLLTSTLNIW